MTWTDKDGVVHEVNEVPQSTRDLLYKPIIEAQRRAQEELELLAQAIRLEGIEARPMTVEAFEEPPDFIPACNHMAWIGKGRLDAEPRAVTCLDCLAATS